VPLPAQLAGTNSAAVRRMKAPRTARLTAGRVVGTTLLACTNVIAMACDAAPRRDAPDSHAAGERADTLTTVPQPPAVAVTIDDLPWIGAVGPLDTRADALHRMIDAFVTRSVPALGFANCDRAGAGAPLLRMWVDAGLELGNHTAAHLDLNVAPLQQWLRDVQSCHDTVRAITSATQIYFRYPFLHQGPTAERQAAALTLLAELQSPVAHVSIDNSDWILAVAYGNAINAGDSARARAVGDAFVEHILTMTQHYQQVARQRIGRDVPHVLLLHANLLVADHVGTLLDRLRTEHGFSFVTVEAAQRDPVYTRPDGYTGGQGLSWLYRMAPAMPELHAWDDEQARRLRQQWR
jgi:peptidoglycan/xylan/chitin deacetylase (PgdA/CDA1 family)